MNRWPFLVARGRRVGHRVVLAPDFLVQNGQHGMLAEHVGASPAGPEGNAVVELPCSEFGTLVATYRAEQAMAAELVPGSEPDVLRDRLGRPLELLYGVVTGSALTPVDDHDLALARAAAIDAYRHFLADEEGAEVLPSHGLSTDAEPPPRPVTAIARSERPAPVRPSVRRSRAWIVVVAILVVAAVVVAVMLVAGLFS